MSTVREIFREAISTQDWGGICQVYEAITGEAAPDVPQASPMDDVLNQQMAITPRPENPLDQQMEVVDADDLLADDDDDLLSPAEATTIVTSTQIPDVLPASVSELTVQSPQRPMDTPTPDAPPADVAAEFYIEHGSGQGTANDDGDTQCRKESMSIPQTRKNRFNDNGKAFADEKVTTNPDNPKLGIQSIRPRGLVRDDSLGANTGQQVDVICKLCGKQELVAARLSTGYNTDPEHNTYKCNECNTPNGRAKVMRKQRNDQLNSNAPRRGTDTQRR